MSRVTMRLALCSLDQAWLDKKANIRRCQDMAETARKYGADVCVFPEMTLTGFSMDTDSTAESREASESLLAFQDIARLHRLNVVAGLVFRCGTKATNTLLHVNSDGALAASYNKIHPFSYAHEDRYFQRGDCLATSIIDDVTVGFSICYDLRFPELFTGLCRTAEVVINIANWPHRRIQHWRILLAARAIENQVFVAGVNRTGTDGNGLEYEKSSTMIHPSGEPIRPFYSEPELDICEIHRADLLSYRQSFCTRQDRVPGLYRNFLR